MFYMRNSHNYECTWNTVHIQPCFEVHPYHGYSINHNPYAIEQGQTVHRSRAMAMRGQKNRQTGIGYLAKRTND